MPCPGLLSSVWLLMGWRTLLLAFLPVAHHRLLCVLAQSWPSMLAVCLSQDRHGTSFMPGLGLSWHLPVLFMVCIVYGLCHPQNWPPSLSSDCSSAVFPFLWMRVGFVSLPPNEPIFLSTFPPFLWTILWLLSILLIFPTLLNINFFDFSHKHPIFSLHVLF